MKIKEAALHVDAAFNIVQQVFDDEYDALNNMPENLEYSDRYEKMEKSADALEEAVNKLEEVKDLLEEAAE